ncbi:MAG: hypothetical protein Q8P04_01680 [bacterium]|nr:hypothetical protein [bacterium]
MENIINSEIALFVLAVCSGILTIALLILIWRIVRLLRIVEEVALASDEILERVKDEIELASIDIEKVRQRLYRNGLRAASIAKYLGDHFSGKRKNKGRKN